MVDQVHVEGMNQTRSRHLAEYGSANQAERLRRSSRASGTPLPCSAPWAPPLRRQQSPTCLYAPPRRLPPRPSSRWTPACVSVGLSASQKARPCRKTSLRSRRCRSADGEHGACAPTFHGDVHRAGRTCRLRHREGHELAAPACTATAVAGRCWRRQVCTRLAFNLCGLRATDAPDSAHCASTGAFRSSETALTPLTLACPVVSIHPLRDDAAHARGSAQDGMLLA
jgi:hypothetical protein